MTILIADSGSTKTDWRLISDQTIQSFTTPGYNPYHFTLPEMVSSLKKNLPEEMTTSIPGEVFFTVQDVIMMRKKN